MDHSPNQANPIGEMERLLTKLEYAVQGWGETIDRQAQQTKAAQAIWASFPPEIQAAVNQTRADLLAGRPVETIPAETLLTRLKRQYPGQLRPYYYDQELQASLDEIPVDEKASPHDQGSRPITSGLFAPRHLPEPLSEAEAIGLADELFAEAWRETQSPQTPTTISFDELLARIQILPPARLPSFIQGALRRLKICLAPALPEELLDEINAWLGELALLVNSSEGPLPKKAIKRLDRHWERLEARAKATDPEEKTAYLLMAFGRGLDLLLGHGDLGTLLETSLAALAEFETQSTSPAVWLNHLSWVERHIHGYQLPSLKAELSILGELAEICRFTSASRLQGDIAALVTQRISFEPA